MPSQRPDSGELVLRPQTWRRPTGSMSLALLGWILASAFFLLKFHGLLLVVFLALDLALVAVAAALFARSYRRTKLTLAGGTLTYSGLLRDRIVVGERRKARVVEVEVQWNRTFGRRTHLWMLVNDDGRTEVDLNLDAWNLEQLEDLRNRLELPIDAIDKPLSGVELQKAYPGTVPWLAVHPILATYLLIALIVLIVLAART